MTRETYHDCPMCGAPASAWGDRYCGSCEAHYHGEKHRQEALEINELKHTLLQCSCEDGCCGNCISNSVRILSLQGREQEVHNLLNN